jgi:hexosaminidase
VDLGKSQSVSAIGAGFLSDQTRWIFLPAAVEYAVGLTPGGMRTVYTKTLSTDRMEQPSVKEISAKFAPTRARYVRIRAKSIGTCPPWHPGAGRKAWLFVDEIVVR